MNDNTSVFFPIFIIVVGIGYLLHNLGILPVTPWQIVKQYWPALLVLYGVSEIARTAARRNRDSGHEGDIVFPALVALFGAYLLAQRLGLPVVRISWSIIWPVIIILIGLSLLFDKDRHTKIEIKADGPLKSSTLLGEFHRGAGNWILEDTFIRHGVGSVTLDLTQAIIPDREVVIDISGCVGESVIYLPPDLPIKADCQISMGDITVLGQNESGLQRRITFVSPGYEQAARKLDIRIRWKVGDIKIRRIG